MNDFLRFETMITPVLIQVLFWLVVIACVITGILAIAYGDERDVVIGLGFIFLGPILARIYAEILIVIFRINDHLRQIRDNTQPA
jgi:Domain of unknown function (DUF4282)